MRRDAGVLGVFSDPGAAARAAQQARGAGYVDLRAAMPAPFPALVAALGRPKSKLGSFTLAGAMLGTACGFGLCIATSLAWPLITGGKEIVSLPPFAIIAFELTVLLGATTNLVAMALSSALGRRHRDVPHDPRFSGDRVGLFVAGGDSDRAEAILRGAGAEEVRHVR